MGQSSNHEERKKTLPPLPQSLGSTDSFPPILLDSFQPQRRVRTLGASKNSAPSLLSPNLNGQSCSGEPGRKVPAHL